MFKLKKKNLPLETYEIRYTNKDGMWAELNEVPMKDSSISLGIKDFIKEIGDAYWLNFEDFGYGPLPIDYSPEWGVNFACYNFSELTKMYLVIQKDAGREIDFSSALLDAVMATMGSHLNHVSNRLKKKVLKILDDLLFYALDEELMKNSFWVMENMVEHTRR